MSADKHPAEVLADKQERLEFDEPHSTADMLRRIPALEAERVHLRAKLEQRHERQHEAEALAGQYLVQRDDARSERDQLRAEVDALREANSTFATAAILPDDKVIVDKTEVEALRADAERYRFMRRPFMSHRQYKEIMYAVDELSEELMDSAIDAARKQQ